MRLDWEPVDGEWPTKREFKVLDSEGKVVEVIGTNPTLEELRASERKFGKRFDLLESDLICVECENLIEYRFSANSEGELLCWDCATQQESNSETHIQTNVDPTKAVLSESKLHEKSLCDHVINVATGCRHGCKFCYVPTTPAVETRDEMLAEQANVDDPQEDWGSYLLYRDDLPERLRRELKDRDFENDWKRTERGRGVVMLSSGTDCYQDRRAAQITRGCVQELIEHDIPVRILTRSPAVTRDIDLFKEAGDLITVGSSIPSFDAELVRAIEPGAPPPKARWRALDQLQKEGIPVYVSFSPTYPLMTKYEIDTMLGHFRALGENVVVFHEPINPRGQNFEMLTAAAEELGRPELVKAFEQLQDESQWVSYAVEQINLVQQRAEKMYPGLEIHTWPDRLLVQKTSGELSKRLQAMREAVSPESFDGSSVNRDAAQSVLFEGPPERAELI